MTSNKRGRGRPPVTTAKDLQDAAFEMFMEYGYEETNAAMITAAAGTSRSTFFNYYRVKSDVFWLEIDTASTLFIQQLRVANPAATPFAAITAALQFACGSWSSSDVPWIATNFELIGSPVAVTESAASRIDAIHNAILQFLLERLGQQETIFTISATLTGAVIGAFYSWVQAGVNRGELEPYLKSALTPLQELIPS